MKKLAFILTCYVVLVVIAFLCHSTFARESTMLEVEFNVLAGGLFSFAYDVTRRKK